MERLFICPMQHENCPEAIRMKVWALDPAQAITESLRELASMGLDAARYTCVEDPKEAT